MHKYVEELINKYEDLQDDDKIIEELNHLFEAAYLDGYEWAKNDGWWHDMEDDIEYLEHMTSNKADSSATLSDYNQYQDITESKPFTLDDDMHIPGLPLDRKQ